MKLRALLSIPALLFVTLAFGQSGPVVQWSFSVSPERSAVLAQATIEEGWHLYATELPRNDGPFPTIFTVDSSAAHGPLLQVLEPLPEEVDDPNFGMRVRYHSGEPLFLLTLDRREKKAFPVKGTVEYMVCNDVTCLPPTVVDFSVEMPAR